MSDVTNDQLTAADLAYGKGETTEEEHDTGNRLEGQHVEPDEPEDETVAVSEASFLLDEDRSRYQEQWDSIQIKFVDEPKQSVQEADVLVADVIQQVATRFAESLNSLEQQWGSGGEVSTEDLRQTLQHYRSFFQRLLATPSLETMI
jgi:hypothetical protein